MSQMQAIDPVSNPPDQSRRTAIGFLNWAHSIDHYVMLIYPTVVIGLESVYATSYADLIALSTASFVAFGVFSLPAGWLADRWSRRKMMATFYLGCGVSLAAAAFAPNLIMLAAALFALGVFAAIYHPVGMAMLIEISQARGRTLAFNGVCGNLGVALAAGITAALASWLGWRGAFLVPAIICLITGVAFLSFVAEDRHGAGARKSVAEVALSQRAALIMFALYIVISITGGLTFNTLLIALPKIVDERLGADVPLIAVGGVATAVFLCGALAQIAVGRLVERFAPHILFAMVVSLQFAGTVWAATATGKTLIVALAVTMAAIYGQVTVGDLVIARYTADAWRGRVYAVRYFLTFVSSGIAVSAIAVLYARGGFDLVLAAIAAIGGILLAAVLGFVTLVSGVERERTRAVAPAE
ncbi:MAG TPA: MFS transporter [Xanthobacteraceae bacterium]|jgi:MFS family permease|nr:MFS transporter [Xanthobacteraceae bacterium]